MVCKNKELSVIADRQIPYVKELFSNFGEVQLLDSQSIDNEKIKDADVLLVRSVTKVDNKLLKNTKVSFVGSATSGVDHIDLAYLRENGITFKNALGCNARSVAEYVLSSLFVVSQQNQFSLTGKTVGIIGCGNIGSILKKFLNSLGIKCLVNDPPRSLFDVNETWSSLDEVLCSDIISLHVPLILDGEHPTLNMVNKNFLSKLKSDVVFINTSRGEVVNENDLLSFKKNKPNSTLILDVWCNEPYINMELLKQVLIPTPHIAGYSFDGKLKATKLLADALCDDKKIPNVGKCSVPINGNYKHLLKMSDPKKILELAVIDSYDVRSDAIALYESCNMQKKQGADYFNELREKYPIRREFDNTILAVDNIDPVDFQKLDELGFGWQKS